MCSLPTLTQRNTYLLQVVDEAVWAIYYIICEPASQDRIQAVIDAGKIFGVLHAARRTTASPRLVIFRPFLPS